MNSKKQSSSRLLAVNFCGQHWKCCGLVCAQLVVLRLLSSCASVWLVRPPRAHHLVSSHHVTCNLAHLRSDVIRFRSDQWSDDVISLPAVLGLTNSEHQVEMEPTAEQHHRVKKDEFEKVQVSEPPTSFWSDLWGCFWSPSAGRDEKDFGKFGICELPRRGMVSLGWLVISPWTLSKLGPILGAAASHTDAVGQNVMFQPSSFWTTGVALVLRITRTT